MEELALAIGDIIVGIDIGTSKVSLVVGEVNNFNQIEIICSTSKKCKSIKRGKIVNEDELVQAIETVVKEAEIDAKFKINSSYVTIPGKYVTIVLEILICQTREYCWRLPFSLKSKLVEEKR